MNASALLLRLQQHRVRSHHGCMTAWQVWFAQLLTEVTQTSMHESFVSMMKAAAVITETATFGSLGTSMPQTCCVTRFKSSYAYNCS